MRVEVKPDHVQFEEEEQGEHYIKDRVKSLTLVKNLSFLAIVLLIAQIVLDIIHLTLHSLPLAVSLLTTSIVFLIGAGLVIYWAGQATKAYKANTELFQPRVNDRLTKTIYIAGLVFACTAIVLLVNLLVQREYSPDYVVAHSAVTATWDETYPGRTVEGISKFLRVISWIQVGFNVYYIIYFLVVARTAFKCLKFDNQAMSYLTFLGNALLLAFGLAVIYLADHALGYADFPQIKAHFPFWNIRGLYFAGICVSAVSLLGFLVDHRSWRIGFLVLSFLLLVLIVLLGNFTGFAYRHVGETYKYYKGVPDVNTCLNRIQFVDLRDLEDYGCPQKYLPHTAECDNPRVTPWEPLEAVVQDATPAPQGASAQEQGAQPTQQQAAADQSQAAADQSQAAADQSQAAADQQQAVADDQQAAADDQQAAADDQSQAAADQQAVADDQQAAADSQQAAADDQQAAADDQQAAADQSGSPDSQAAADQSQDAADQSQAAADQSQAAADDQQAAADDQSQAAADQQAAADDQQASADDQQAAADQSQQAADDQQAAADDQQAAADDQAATVMFVDLQRKLQTTTTDTGYCYNLKCCGILGQLYTVDFLLLANFGLLAMLAAILISVACYYFWFVKWVDAARDKRKDYIWLFVMLATIVAFVVAFASWNLSYPNERLDSNNQHML